MARGIGLGEVITKVLTDTVRKPSDPAAAEEGIFLASIEPSLLGEMRTLSLMRP